MTPTIDNVINTNEVDRQLQITVFTDPLCCWSWAFEPQLQQLRLHLSEKASWTYRMGGLISSWNNFHDEVNSITRPVQMGPVWMHAGQVANMPIYHQLWMTDPPASSYPACIAVKCAQLQSEATGELMLQLLRAACMSEGRNIARQQILFDVAKKLSSIEPSFDIKKFQEDYSNDKGIDAFRSDLELVRYYNINRFPALTIKSSEPKAIIISGYKPFAEILKAIEVISPGIAGIEKK